MSLTPEQIYCDMLAELQYICPDAPSSIIERSIISSMRYLSDHTCLLQTTLKPRVQNCVDDYDLSSLLPDSYEICKIMCVEWCGCCIEHIEKCDPCPWGYEMKTPTCIVIHPMPESCEGDELEVQVAIRPCQDLAEIPPELMKYDDLIKDMSLRNMLGTPKQDYTDIRLALNMDRNIRGRLVDVLCEVQNNFSDRPIKTGEATI